MWQQSIIGYPFCLFVCRYWSVKWGLAASASSSSSSSSPSSERDPDCKPRRRLGASCCCCCCCSSRLTVLLLVVLEVVHSLLLPLRIAIKKTPTSSTVKGRRKATDSFKTKKRSRYYWYWYWCCCRHTSCTGRNNNDCEGERKRKASCFLVTIRVLDVTIHHRVPFFFLLVAILCFRLCGVAYLSGIGPDGLGMSL